ncbi:MAG: hypothetical protein JO138_27275 [Acidobacteriaceae bacterium]|nr:hypothetical protein [Acidobacteriaceae bacterium]
MSRIGIALLAGSLLAGPAVWGQQTSTTQTNPTQNKDIPKQEPRDNNPDLAPQANSAPNTPPAKRHTHKSRKGTSGSSSTRTTSTQR